jgi:hypothetical protein
MPPDPRVEVPEEAVLRVWRCRDHPDCGTTMLVGSTEDENHELHSEMGPICLDCEQEMHTVALVPFSELDAIRKQERQRVEAEYPKAGEMHPADQAFYDLVVKERNHAWAESARHASERDEAAQSERQRVEADLGKARWERHEAQRELKEERESHGQTHEFQVRAEEERDQARQAQQQAREKLAQLLDQFIADSHADPIPGSEGVFTNRSALLALRDAALDSLEDSDG